jgi:serine/threonine-protein kinase
MTPERWRQITDVFHAVLARDPAVREALLDEACAGDAALRGEVDALLAAHRDAGSFGGRPGMAFSGEGGRRLARGAELGPYRIEALVGAGGMGEVYRAHDERLGRDVAIKVLPSHVESDTRLKQRLEREGKALATLSHPHICPVFDVGHQDGVDYLVMEYLEGETLASRLLKGPLPTRQALQWAVEIASALDAAHGKGVVHRDLKPGNVMITPGGARLLDFGVARQRASPPGSATEGRPPPSTSLTGEGLIVGTLPFMAPEQLTGAEVDARTDIFAFGAVLYEMVAGRKAFEGDSPARLIAAILEHEPVDLATIQPATPPELNHLVRTCLEKDPNRRWQSAADVERRLTWLLRGGSDSGGRTSVTSTYVAAAPARRKRGWLVAGAILALVVGTAVWRGRPSQAPVAAPAPIARSIAVLPFANIGGDKDNEYFSDGLAEELLNALARVPQLRVTGRTSSFRFKDRKEDLREIGRMLNASTLLEGSVRKAGTRVRIVAQLVNADDGYQLWAQSYDAELDDIFAVQDGIARSVAGALKVVLLAPGNGGPATARKGNSEAYNLYLQGRYFAARASEKDLARAGSSYERALKLDPLDARAWVGLARVHDTQAGWGYIPLEEGVRKARQEVEKALELDPHLSEAYVALGELRRAFDWDWAGADAAFKRAYELEPGSARVVRASSLLAGTFGRFDEALERDESAVALDPLDAATHTVMGVHAWRARSLPDAEAALRKAVELQPDFPGGHMRIGRVYLTQSNPVAALAEMEREKEPFFRLYGVALAYHALGRSREADAALADLIQNHGGDSAYQIAEVHAFRGELEEAFAWLERAYAQKDPGLPVMLVGDPLLDRLKPDPRYEAFLRKMRLLS